MLFLVLMENEMARFARYLLAFLLMTGAGIAQNAAERVIPKPKQTKLALYMSPQEAVDLMKKEGGKTLFVDVRTRSEIQFVGWAPMVDANVPFVEPTEYWDWDELNRRFKLETNPTFSQDIERQLVRKGLKKGDRIIIMCRSGDRSARAIDALADAGFTNVWNQIEGFEGDLSKETKQRNVNGWRNAGLPWSYELDKAKMYLKSN